MRFSHKRRAGFDSMSQTQLHRANGMTLPYSAPAPSRSQQKRKSPTKLGSGNPFGLETMMTPPTPIIGLHFEQSEHIDRPGCSPPRPITTIHGTLVHVDRESKREAANTLLVEGEQPFLHQLKYSTRFTSRLLLAASFVNLLMSRG